MKHSDWREGALVTCLPTAHMQKWMLLSWKLKWLCKASDLYKTFLHIPEWERLGNCIIIIFWRARTTAKLSIHLRYHGKESWSNRLERATCLLFSSILHPTAAFQRGCTSTQSLSSAWALAKEHVSYRMLNTSLYVPLFFSLLKSNSFLCCS